MKTFIVENKHIKTIYKNSVHHQGLKSANHAVALTLVCAGMYNLNSAGNSSSAYNLSEKYTLRTRQFAWI